MMHPDKRQTIILALALAVISGALLAWQYNLVPEIGKFFAAEPAPSRVSIENPETQGFVMTRPSYDYAVDVMKDGDTYKMWWCAGAMSTVGDEIAYSTAPSATGPWSPAVGVFQGTGNNGTNGQPLDTDGSHTCDPSVIRVNGTYYMYYTGGVEAYYDTAGNFYSDVTEAVQHAPVYPFPGGVMVATSPDGVHWTRGNGGKVVVRANIVGGEPGFENLPGQEHPIWPQIHLVYGAGQQFAVYKGGYFYLAFTDTTGKDSDPGNGAGIYLIRSRDPFFQDNPEELVAPGVFAPRTAQNRTAHALIRNFDSDMQYSDELKSFIVASSFGRGTPEGDAVQFRFFNETFGAEITDPLTMRLNWFGGLGLASDPEGHSIPAGPGRVRLDAYVAYPTNGVVNDVFATDINHVGGTLVFNAPDRVPLGNFDGFYAPDERTGYMTGWTFDPDEPGMSIEVRLYFDGPAGCTGGCASYTAQTTKLREDVNTPYHISGTHGFEYLIPEQYRDGKEHSVFAYGINSAGNDNNAFLGERAFTIEPTATSLPTSPPPSPTGTTPPATITPVSSSVKQCGAWEGDLLPQGGAPFSESVLRVSRCMDEAILFSNCSPADVSHTQADAQGLRFEARPAGDRCVMTLKYEDGSGSVCRWTAAQLSDMRDAVVEQPDQSTAVGFPGLFIINGISADPDLHCNSAECPDCVALTTPMPTSTADGPGLGDTDNDGKVDIFDYNTVVSNFGKKKPKAGDLDGNGKVDIFDYNVVVSNFGRHYN